MLGRLKALLRTALPYYERRWLTYYELRSIYRGQVDLKTVIGHFTKLKLSGWRSGSVVKLSCRSTRRQALGRGHNIRRPAQVRRHFVARRIERSGDYRPRPRRRRAWQCCCSGFVPSN